MSKMKKKRAVSLLLCLGIVATMSFGSLTVSATDDYPQSTELVVAQDNDFFSLDGDNLKVKKDGYYSLFACFYSNDADYNIVSSWKSALDENKLYDSWSEAVDTVDCYVKHKSGDVISLSVATQDFAGDLFLAYRESKDASTEIYKVDCWSQRESSSNDAYPDGMFYVSTVSTSKDVCEVNVKASPAEDREIADFRIYYKSDDGESELLDFGDVDYEALCGDGMVIPLYVNSWYEFVMTDSLGETQTYTDYEVTCIDTTVVPEPDVSGAPKIEYSLSTSDTGLSASDALSVIVTTNRNCTITGEDMPVFMDTSSAEFIIPQNGVYTFYAIDPDTEESSEVTVTITSFGDGSIDPDYADNEHTNDNPLNGDNKNNYWQNLENNGGLSADGNLIDLVSLTVNDDGSVTAKGGKSNPSDKLGVLPQTGITSWVVAIGCSLFAIIAGTFLMFRKGIFKKLSRKGGK